MVLAFACSLKSAWDLESFVAAFSRKPPVFLPETTPVFSNAAFQLLGYVLSNVTGMAYDEVLWQSILTPLGMSESGLLGPNSPSFRAEDIDAIDGEQAYAPFPPYTFTA